MATAHRAYFGQSGTGKTTLAADHAADAGANVLFFNTQEEDVLPGFTRADRTDLLHLLAAGRIDYVPAADDRTARMELDVIVREMFKHRERHNVLIVDEAQEYAPEGSRPGPLELVARRGRRHNVELWVVSQHPADLAKKVLRQVSTVYLFEMPYSDQYLRQQNIPVEHLRALHEEGGEYSYAVWDGLNLDGPHRLDLS